MEVLKEIGSFLSVFTAASDDLEGDRYPTINKVLLWFSKLKSHCAPKSTDPEYMKHIRSRAGELLREKFKISLKHKIATFLTPRFKALKMLLPAERDEIHAEVRRLTEALIPTLQAQAEPSTQGDDQLGLDPIY